MIVTSFDKKIPLHLDENYPNLTRIAYNVEAVGLFFDALLNIDPPEFDVLLVPPDRYIVNMGTSKLVNFVHKK